VIPLIFNIINPPDFGHEKAPTIRCYSRGIGC